MASKHYMYKKEYRPDEGSYFVNEKDLITLINKGETHKFREVPYHHKIGDYVTCVPAIEGFDLSDYVSSSVKAKEGLGCWKEGLTFKIGRKNSDVAIFPVEGSIERSGGVYANWIRPATPEEIANYEKNH